MNKSEFLDILRQQLEGEIPSNEIYSNIHYYDEYIEHEVASGKSEEEVMTELGDPRLIAKTLIDADEAPVRHYSYEESYYTEDSNNRYEQQERSNDQEEPIQKHHRLDLTTWYGKALIILVAAAIIFLLVTVLSVLLPIIIVAVLICIIISIFRKNR